MGVKLLIGQEISFAETDVIVNASNGCGWMGGFLTTKKLYSGVAEHLNYYTHGSIEKEAKKNARRFRRISAWVFGTTPGNIFVTSHHGLNCKEVIHAVTMRYPGTLSSYKKVRSCLQEVFRYCQEHGYRSVSMPLLGCGTGKLKARKVLTLIRDMSEKYDNIHVFVYSLKEIK